jgi:hypothetical protein
VESLELSLITPPNFPGGGGSASPLIVVVPLGEPGAAGSCGEIGVANAATPTVRGNVQNGLQAAPYPMMVPAATVIAVVNLQGCIDHSPRRRLVEPSVQRSAGLFYQRPAIERL